MHPAGPVTAEGLQRIRDEEEEHFHLLKKAMESLGADPTAQAPDADVSGVAAMGIQQVLNDRPTTMPQCLESLLSLELADHADHAGWELLIKLAGELGLDDLAEEFRHALAQEDVHVERIRPATKTWSSRNPHVRKWKCTEVRKRPDRFCPVPVGARSPVTAAAR